MRGTQESQLECRLVSDDRLWRRVGFQTLFEDALNTVHIHQLKIQSTTAGGIESLCTVSIRESEKLLRLP